MRTFESEQNHKVQLELSLGILLMRWLRSLMPLISAELLEKEQAFNLTNFPVATSFSTLLLTYYQRIYNQFGKAFLRMIENQIRKIDPSYQMLTEAQLEAFQTELFNQYTTLSLGQSNLILLTLQAGLNKGVGSTSPSTFLKLFNEKERRRLRHLIAPDQTQLISEDVKQKLVNFIMAQNAQIDATKDWETRKDDKVRPAHKIAQSQRRPFNQTYLVDNENLMYPRDSAGSLANILGCRCASRFLFIIK